MAVNQHFEEVRNQFDKLGINWTLSFLKTKCQTISLKHLKECQKFIDEFIWEVERREKCQ